MEASRLLLEEPYVERVLLLEDALASYDWPESSSDSISVILLLDLGVRDIRREELVCSSDSLSVIGVRDL